MTKNKTDHSLLTKVDNKNEHDLTEYLENTVLIGETPYRYVIVIIYCMLSFANGMQWVTFSSVAKDFKREYNLDQFQVDLFSMIYMIIYPFLSFPSSYIIDNKNIRLGVYSLQFNYSFQFQLY
jgi:fucose permease